MKQASLYFTAPRRVEIREQDLPALSGREVLVRTLFSAISAGSELLVYRGLCPDDIALDATIPGLQGQFGFPTRYGYSVVGKVLSCGDDTPPEWKGRLVFCFHSHESHFLADPLELHALPADVQPEEALFLPNLETAINLVMDGRPMLGERVVLFGQGIVGLLTTALLAEYPLARLITLDRFPLRRTFSLAAGADTSLDPAEPGVLAALAGQKQSSAAWDGADLVYEVSGSTGALEQALAVAGFSGRIVIGSWYGQEKAHLNLGGWFHRSRIRLISSQVSSISPELTGRWTKSRRLDVAWSLLRKVDPLRFVTHRFPFDRAGEAYASLDQDPGRCVQVILAW